MARRRSKLLLNHFFRSAPYRFITNYDRESTTTSTLGRKSLLLMLLSTTMCTKFENYLIDINLPFIGKKKKEKRETRAFSDADREGQLNSLLYIASQFQEAVKTSRTARLKAGFSAEITMINWRILESKVDEFQISRHRRLNSFTSYDEATDDSTKLIFLAFRKMCVKKKESFCVNNRKTLQLLSSYLFPPCHFVLLLRFSLLCHLPDGCGESFIIAWTPS